jgi:sulfur-carrier protein
VIAVKLPARLRRHAGGADRLELSGATVGGCLQEMESRYPGVSAELRDGTGGLVASVNLYLNGQDVRYLGGLDAPVRNGDTITILMPIAGGAAPRY